MDESEVLGLYRALHHGPARAAVRPPAVLLLLLEWRTVLRPSLAAGRDRSREDATAMRENAIFRRSHQQIGAAVVVVDGKSTAQEAGTVERRRTDAPETMADGLSDDVVAAFKEAFAQFDTDGNGHITEQELKAVSPRRGRSHPTSLADPRCTRPLPSWDAHRLRRAFAGDGRSEH